MTRRLLNLLTLLSLLLCVATCVLWALPMIRVTSGGAGLDLWRFRGTTMVQRRVGIVAIPGRLLFQSKREVHYYWSPYPIAEQPFPDRLTRMGPERPLAAQQHWGARETPLEQFGFAWDNVRVLVHTHRMIYYRSATVPTWLLVVFFAIPPALRLRRELAQRRQHRIGHCRRCGYDLRATPGRCPECGHAPAGAAA